MKRIALFIAVLAASPATFAKSHVRAPAPKSAAAIREATLHYKNALDAFNGKRYDLAVDEWTKAQELDPSPIKLANIAQAQRKAGKIDAAIAAYERLLATAPGSEFQEEAERHLSNLRAQKNEERAGKLLGDKQYAEALEALQASYKLRPEPRVLSLIGDAYRLSGKAEEAIDTYQRCLQTELAGPLKVEAERHLAELRSSVAEARAQALTAGHQYEPAAAALEEAYKQRPQVRLLFALGQAQRRAGRNGDALRSLERFVDGDPQGPDRGPAEEELREVRVLVEEDRGVALMSRGENARALAVLEGACKIKPLPSTLLKLGQAQRLAGQPGPALYAYRQVLGQKERVTVGQRLEAEGAAKELTEVLALRREVDQSRRPPPVYKRAWFWGVVAAVAVGAGTAGVLAATLRPSTSYPSATTTDGTVAVHF